MTKTRRGHRRIVMIGFCLACLGMGAIPFVPITSRLFAQTSAPADPPAPVLPDPPEQDEREVLILQALEQPTDLKVNDVLIKEAIEQLGDQTGIPIRLAPGTLALLPYGSQTKLTATIENRPLKESLSAILRPLALTFTPERDRVLVQPTPPLRRIARRATWEELSLLDKLTSQPWSRELFAGLKFQFEDARAADAGTHRETLGQLAASVGEGTAAEVLERACEQHGWTWYPAGELIVVLTKTRQIERQLEKRVSLRYSQAGLHDALLDLAGQGGVLLRFDPGVLASLPPQSAERFSLAIENTTVRQALEVIVGETGLSYLIDSTGVRITNNALAPRVASGPAGVVAEQARVSAEAAAALRAANPIVGQVTFPMPDGASFAFFVRQDDLPPEVNELRRNKIIEAVNHIRRQLLADQPKD